MPVYICNSAEGSIQDSAKEKIAADITRIHCAVTGAPPVFVHAFFLEEPAENSLGGKTAILRGSIRSGRSDAQKSQIAAEMRQSIHEHTGIALNAIEVTTADTPASWVMEGGDIFPEPGEEAEWLTAHEAKRGQRNV